MRIVTDKQYDSTYWQAHRGIAGASDAEHVATPAKGEYPKSVKTLIYRLIAEQFDPFYGMHDEVATRAMKSGLRNEPRAKAFLKFEFDWNIQDVGFCLSDCGRFGLSPDILVGDDGGSELKAPNIETHVKYMLSNGELLLADYKPQVHWSLAASGRKWWKLISWNPFLPPVVVHIEPDEYTEKLRANMERFWTEYQESLAIVTAKFPPPPAPEVVEFAGFGAVEMPAFVSPW